MAHAQSVKVALALRWNSVLGLKTIFEEQEVLYDEEEKTSIDPLLPVYPGLRDEGAALEALLLHGAVPVRPFIRYLLHAIIRCK